MNVVRVTVRQVLAARVRVAGDRQLGNDTPDWIVRLASTAIPPCRTRAADREATR